MRRALYSHDLTPEDLAGIDQIRESLGDWALADIEAIALRHPRLAFVGISAWLDATTRIYCAPTKPYLSVRIRRFARAYAPRYAPHAPKLARGMRHKLLHEYGTRNVMLSHERPGLHLTTTPEGYLILNIETLAADCRKAFDAFLAELTSNGALRHTALAASKGLIAPVEYRPPQTAVSFGVQGAHALTGSPTGPRQT